MSRNGSGTYSLPAGNPVTTGTTISSTWANGTLSDIATAITQSIAYDGQTTPVANLPMGTYAHTGVGNATVRTMYASAAQVEDGTLNYLTSVAGTNTITATAPVGMTGYVAGQVFRFIAAGANTGACTLNLNSIGAKSLVKTDGSALVSGDIASGAAVQVMYDGTNFQLLSDANGATETVTNLTVTGTLTTNNDATIHGLTVGKGGGNVASNTAHGLNALASNTTGTYNTAIGLSALSVNTTGSRNTAVGALAATAITTGVSNVAIGIGALLSNVTGSNNIAIGDIALGNNTASNNVAIGHQALQASTVSNNTAVGYYALQANTTGTPNDAFGYQALFSNTTGGSNVAIGYQSLYNNTTGVQNVAIGTQTAGAAAAGNTTNVNITAIGYGALSKNTADNNTAIGSKTLLNNTTGTESVAIGYNALTTNTTGTSNVAVGYRALEANTIATVNTALGSFAGVGITTGSGNTLIGNSAGDELTTGANNVIIGYNASANAATGAGQIVIGQGGIGQGDNYVTLGRGGTNYIYNQFTTNATWTKASDQRIKANIQDLPIGLDFINELKVKSYNWKPNNEYPTDIIGYSEENTQDTEAVMYGMIAQDVKAAMDKLGYEHFGGWNVREADGLQGLSNEMFVLPLINAVKELSAQNKDLLARIEALESK